MSGRPQLMLDYLRTHGPVLALCNTFHCSLARHSWHSTSAISKWDPPHLFSDSDVHVLVLVPHAMVQRHKYDPVHKKAATVTIKQGKSPNDRPVTPPTGNNTKNRRLRVAAQTATQPTAPRKDWSWPTKIRRPERSRRNHGPGSDPSVVSEEATSTSPLKEVAVDTLPCPLRQAASCGSLPLSKSERSNMKIRKGDFLALILSRKIACFWYGPSCLHALVKLANLLLIAGRTETNQFLAHSGM
ncbi:hypothetical protein BC827DRAFT_1155478 [Russula dissimulans]|nr:hypothetical protein BC827DRAFT_1155478 [Russula dissimulans]